MKTNKKDFTFINNPKKFLRHIRWIDFTNIFRRLFHKKERDYFERKS